MKIAARIHGDAIHGQEAVEFQTWTGIKSRTSNPNDPRWKYYGAQGVTMAPQWRDSYETFLADVGRRPEGRYSIDRYPNPNGNYEPGNVRWATSTEQQRNLRTNHLLTVGNETMCLSAWEERLGLPKRLLSKRIRNGCPPERLFEPSLRKNSVNATQSEPASNRAATKAAPTNSK
jgi:hypothetical protein